MSENLIYGNTCSEQFFFHLLSSYTDDDTKRTHPKRLKVDGVVAAGAGSLLGMLVIRGANGKRVGG